MKSTNLFPHVQMVTSHFATTANLPPLRVKLPATSGSLIQALCVASRLKLTSNKAKM